MAELEAWLSGPVQGIPQPLMPAAHALVDARRELIRAAEPLAPARLWLKPGGAASVGFHLRHVPGSLDRLLTYARGEALTAEQLAALGREGEPGDPPTPADRLVEDLGRGIDAALDVLRSLSPDALQEPREVGRKRLPSTVWGLVFHAAEHARRHAGQAVATSAIVRGLGLP